MSVFIFTVIILAFILFILNLNKSTTKTENILFISFMIIALLIFCLKEYEIYKDKIVISYLGIIKRGYVLTFGRRINILNKPFRGIATVQASFLNLFLEKLYRRNILNKPLCEAS